MTIKKMENEYKEKRAYPRVPSEISAKINNEKCHISNISAGGALLLTTYQGKIGEEVLVIFEFSNKYFEKIANIREIMSSSRLSVPVYINGKSRNFMYKIHISFLEPIREEDISEKNS